MSNTILLNDLLQCMDDGNTVSIYSLDLRDKQIPSAKELSNNDSILNDTLLEYSGMVGNICHDTYFSQRLINVDFKVLLVRQMVEYDYDDYPLVHDIIYVYYNTERANLRDRFRKASEIILNRNREAYAILKDR